MPTPLSILDLARIGPGETARDSIAASVELARTAEEHGYQRVWYAERHNMATIASSAPAVLIAHVGTFTRTIRLGSGGVMLPTPPLTIAEQYGTLDAMYPGRIDLGLGRAPGSDQNTMRALRRDAQSAEAFPQDVLELQAYLAGRSRIPGVDAVPGRDPRLAVHPRLVVVRRDPWRGAWSAMRVRLALRATGSAGGRGRVPAGVPPVRTTRPAVRDRRGQRRRRRTPPPPPTEQFQGTRRTFATAPVRARAELHRRAGRPALAQGADAHVDQMLQYSALGTPSEVREYLETFIQQADADRPHRGPPRDRRKRLRSVALLAEAMPPAHA